MDLCLVFWIRSDEFWLQAQLNVPWIGSVSTSSLTNKSGYWKWMNKRENVFLKITNICQFTCTNFFLRFSHSEVCNVSPFLMTTHDRFSCRLETKLCENVSMGILAITNGILSCHMATMWLLKRSCPVHITRAQTQYPNVETLPLVVQRGKIRPLLSGVPLPKPEYDLKRHFNDSFIENETNMFKF